MSEQSRDMHFLEASALGHYTSEQNHGVQYHDAECAKHCTTNMVQIKTRDIIPDHISKGYKSFNKYHKF